MFESNIVGAERFVAASSGFGTVQGMTLAGGHIYCATISGDLYRVGFIDGAPTGPATQVSGPLVDGINGTARGLFVLAA